MAQKTNYEKMSYKINDIIKHKIASSFYYLMRCAYDIGENSLWTVKYEKPGAFADCEKYVFEKIVSIGKSVLLAEDGRKEVIAELTAKLKEFENIFKPAYLYYKEADKYGDILFSRDAVRDFEGMTVEEGFYYSVKKRTADFLKYCLENDYGLPIIFGRFLSAAPMMITRDKYYDIIRASFAKNAEFIGADRLDEAAAKFCELAYPPASPDYGTIMPDLRADMAAMREKAIESSVDGETLDEHDELTNELTELRYYADGLYSALNSLLMLHAEADAAEDMLNNDPTARDVLSAVKDYGGTDEFEAYKDNIDELIQTNESKYLIKTYELETDFQPRLEEAVSGKTPREFGDALLRYYAVSGYYETKLTDDVYSPYYKAEDGVPPETAPETIKGSADKFMTGLKAALSACPAKLQKQMRRLFYKNIRVFINIGEYFEIAETALIASDDAVKLAFESELTEIFNEYDYDEEEDYEDEDDGGDEFEDDFLYDDPHAGHVHDENCDCGHER